MPSFDRVVRGACRGKHGHAPRALVFVCVLALTAVAGAQSTPQPLPPPNAFPPPWEGYVPYGIPPGHPDGANPFASAVLAPDTHGRWLGPYDWSATNFADVPPGSAFEEIAHAVLLPAGPRRGQVLLWTALIGPEVTTYVDIFDPLRPTSLVRLNQTLASDIFCGCSTILSSGKILTAGGFTPSATEPQPRESYVFDPVALEWLNPDTPELMVAGRYYPTVLPTSRYHGSRPLVLGGQSPFPTGAAIAAWDSYLGFERGFEDVRPPGSTLEFEIYPRAFELSTKHVLVANDLRVTAAPPGRNAAGRSWFLNLAGGHEGSSVAATIATGVQERVYGNAVLLHCLPQHGGRNRVLTFGGSQGIGNGGGSLVVHKSVEELVVNSGDLAGSTWVQKPPMKVQRFASNAVVLPTGDVFIVGGAHNDPLNTPGWLTWAGPVFLPEIYDPGVAPGEGSSTWVIPPNPGAGAHPSQPFALTPRVYHHVAMLLPDGSVFVAGGEQLFGMPAGAPISQSRNFTGLDMANSRWSGEVYEPAYRFQGPRPRFASAPGQIAASGGPTPRTFELRIEASQSAASDVIDRVVMIRPGSVTHHFDNDQRYIELVVASTSGAFPGPVSLKVESPALDLAPLGYYMLFAVLRNGANQRIPSEAAFVRLQ
jgi:hypothetical protein